MFVTLEQVKKHLQIDLDYKDDDCYLLYLIDVAEDAVEKNCDIALSEQGEGGEIPPSTFHSILLLIGNLYNNREATTYSTITEVPFAYKYLINLNRNFTIK